MKKAILTVLLLVPLAALNAADASKQKPNILFIISDDLNNSLGCYGNLVVKTPHLDRLAAQGVRFDRAFCQFPLCGPSRSSFMSGVWPAKTRVFDNTVQAEALLKDRLLMPEFFKQHSYRTARIGKVMHFSELESSHGLWDYSEESAGTDATEIRLQNKERQRNAAVKSGAAKDIVAEHFLWARSEEPEETFGDAVKTTRAIAWMKAVAGSGRPFFLALGLRKPHHPYVAPARYFDFYSPGQVTWAAEPPEHIKSIPADALTAAPGSRHMTDQERREIIRAYYACVSMIDAQVGRLLAAVDELKISDETIVVFLGDNGYHLGEHRQPDGAMWHKMSLFDVVARVPLIIRAPRQQGGGNVCAHTIQLLDLYPTLAECAGLPTPPGLDGHSLVPLLKDSAAAWSHAAFTFIRSKKTRLGTVVTQGSNRYIEWSRGSRGAQLCDLKTDPHELNNLISDPECELVLKQMRQLIKTAPTPY